MGDVGVTRVYLVRHGQSQKNTLDKGQLMTAKQYDEYLRWQTEAPLTQRGVEEVYGAANWLAQVIPAPVRLYADTTARTLQTGSILAGRLGLSAIPTSELREVQCRGFPAWLPPLPLRAFILLDRLALFIPWPNEGTWYTGMARAQMDLCRFTEASLDPAPASVVAVSHHLFIQLVVLYARLSRGWKVTRTDKSPAGISVVERVGA